VPALKAAIEATERPSRDALLSLNARGEPWTEFALGLAFGRACKRAGLDGWRFHDLRHFFVTQLFRGGAPAPAVQALAGHADLATTQLYAHVAALDLEDAIRKLTGS
jgi:site-specific recombinase XerD